MRACVHACVRVLTDVTALSGEALLTGAAVRLLRALTLTVHTPQTATPARRLAPQVAQRSFVALPAVAAVRARVHGHARPLNTPRNERQGGVSAAVARPTFPKHSLAVCARVDGGCHGDALGCCRLVTVWPRPAWMAVTPRALGRKPS